MSDLADIGKKYSRNRYRIAVEYEKRDTKGVTRRTRVMNRFSALEAQYALDGFMASLEPEVTILGSGITTVNVGNERPLPERYGVVQAALDGEAV